MHLSTNETLCTRQSQEVKLSCLFHGLSISWQWSVHWLMHGVDLRPIPWPSFSIGEPSDVSCFCFANWDSYVTISVDDIHPWNIMEHLFLIVQVHDSGMVSNFLSKKLYHIGGLVYTTWGPLVQFPWIQHKATSYSMLVLVLGFYTDGCHYPTRGSINHFFNALLLPRPCATPFFWHLQIQQRKGKKHISSTSGLQVITQNKSASTFFNKKLSSFRSCTQGFCQLHRWKHKLHTIIQLGLFISFFAVTCPLLSLFYFLFFSELHTGGYSSALQICFQQC